MNRQTTKHRAMIYPTLYPGHVIREMRKKAGLTVYGLSKRSKVTQRNISLFEKGGNITISTYLKLYKALKDDNN